MSSSSAPAAISDHPSASTISSDSGSDASPPWSSLPADLVDIVGWRVLAAGDLLDYVRLRAACAHWRRSTASPRGRGVLDPRFHPRRWKMMPSPSTTRRFVNTSTGAHAHQRIPLLGDHVVLGSVDGILLLLLERPPRSVLLLHPFTGDSLHLPPLPSPICNLQALPGFPAALSVSAATGVATVKIAATVHGERRVLFASTGQQQWRASAWDIEPFTMPVPFQGKLYALEPHTDNDGSSSPSTTTTTTTWPIVELDPLLPAPKLIATFPAAEFGRGGSCYGLNVGAQGGWGGEPELRVIGHGRNALKVFRVADLVAGKIAPSVNIPIKMRRRKDDSPS